jgi:hypothetical protein
MCDITLLRVLCCHMWHIKCVTKSCSLLTERANIATEPASAITPVTPQNYPPIQQYLYIAWICLHCFSYTATVGNIFLAIQRLSPSLYLYWLLTHHSSMCFHQNLTNSTVIWINPFLHPTMNSWHTVLLCSKH